ncbi:MAG TPA: hypothetical protein VND21_06560 [Planctomycetota bacterium]|nr:hypothetical protein [Planctomycetota bacterium]
MSTAFARGLRLGLSRSHARTLARLGTPARIQDFVTGIPVNFEPEGDTCYSVAEALRRRRAHCIEAAFVAACALWMAGERPLLLDFQAIGDDDHVAALFRRGSCWGAISKSNHVGIRWRDPVYRTVRELGMSYFHEYTRRGKKRLRRVSRPYDLRRHDPGVWVTGRDPCWDVAEALDASPHLELVSPAQARRLRRRDALERVSDEIVQMRAPRA